jgi:hypothetical protein
MYVQTGNAGTITKTACEAVTGETKIFHVTDPAKRHLDPHTAVLVYDSDVLQTTGYRLHAAAGQVYFDSAPGGPVTLSGKYYALTAVSMVDNWETQMEWGVQETSGIGTATGRTFVGLGLLGFTVTASRKREGDTWQARATANGTKFILKLYEDLANTRAWVGYGVLTGAPLTVPLEGLVTETLTFQGDQEITFTTDDT